MREMIGVLTISPSHATSRSQSHQVSSGSGASGPLGSRRSSSRTSSTCAPVVLGGLQRGLQQDLGAAVAAARSRGRAGCSAIDRVYAVRLSRMQRCA